MRICIHAVRTGTSRSEGVRTSIIENSNWAAFLRNFHDDEEAVDSYSPRELA